MSNLKRLALAVVAALLMLAAEKNASLAAPAGGPNSGVVDFSGSAAIIELKSKLVPYHGPCVAPTDGSCWYMISALNNAVRPATRVFMAAQPANAVLRFWPLPARPAIVQVAASDPQVIVESARAYGRHIFRVTLPPASTATLAIRVAYDDPIPSVLAWSEPALVSHNRQMAVSVAAIAGVVAAAMAIMLGLAVMTGHPAPSWASLLLVLIFVLRLAITGTLDAGWSTHIGGPYGLEVFVAGLATAVGLRLADFIVPVETLRADARKWFDGALIGLAALSVLAFLGFPGAMTVVDVVILAAVVAVTAYFLRCGRIGNQAARVAAPSAAVFVLVAIGAAVVALGAFQEDQAAPTIVGGFVAAASVLLALAVAAGEGIAVLPASRYGVARAETIPETPAVSPRVVKGKRGPQTEHLAIAASHQGVFELDFDTDTLRLSREAASLAGLAAEPMAITHTVWMGRVHPEDRAVYRHAMVDYRAHAGTAFRMEFRVKGESGRYRWCEVRATMMGSGAKAERCLGLLADVTTRKEADVVTTEHNTRDALTGLGNRVGLMEALERLNAQFVDITFALLDLDRFKTLHANLGDEGADAILVGLAERLTGRLKDFADVFRVTGDAFAVVFSDRKLDAGEIGAELVDTCAAPFEQKGRNVFAPASVGVALGRDARDPIDLLKNAELALRQAKRRGGGCAHVYSPALEALAPGDAVALEADLRHALEAKQLDVYYQPIMRLSDGSVAGFEALMRWHHPERGLIEPARFIAHCEETGLIIAIGRLALERAAEDLAQWQHAFPARPPLFASVNLSRRQLSDAEFDRVVRNVLAEHKLKPGTLKLEITESAADADARPMLARLIQAGASLAIDDFGTGVSNFNQLRDIPFDTLKLDRSFLSQDADRGAAVILGSIVNLAHDLKRDVVIEGVETGEEAERMRALGCEYAQGFYFSAPLPRAEALDFIARHRRAATRQA